jgi:hypothetical protein
LRKLYARPHASRRRVKRRNTRAAVATYHRVVAEWQGASPPPGTSVEQIDTVYGHLLPDSEQYLRELLDIYDSNAAIAAEGGS